MSRFNATVAPARTANLAGGQAYIQNPRAEIASILLTSFVGDKFYRSAGDELDRLRALIAADPEFAAKAAVYARNEYGMRSISHVVAGEVAEIVKGESWTRKFIRDVVRRPDDMTEIVAYRAARYGLHPLPNALKKGLRAAFGKFDGYQLAKYRGEGKAVSLVDLVNLVKPLPTTRNRDALKQIVAGTLKQTDTWESKLSAGGDKGDAWGSLLAENKLGYMALLRNLRNIAKDADDAAFNMAREQLCDPERVAKSLVLPFRYYTAYREIAVADIPQHRKPLVLAALSMAADHAVSNIPDMDGITLVALDTSGSMTSGRISDHSGTTAAQIGALFAAALCRRLAGRSYLLTFDTQATTPPLNPLDSVLTTTDNIVRGMRGGGTNLDLVFAHDTPVDRVIVLSDMQSWTNGTWGAKTYYGYGRQKHRPANGAFEDYKRRTGANPSVFAFDLTGYGSLQFPADRCCQIAGWSEKVFDLFPMLEQDRNAMVTEIDRVRFT